MLSGAGAARCGRRLTAGCSRRRLAARGRAAEAGVCRWLAGVDAAAPSRSPGRLEQRQFPTLAAYSQATGQDRNSVLVDYDIFMNVPKLNAQDLKTVQRVYKAEDFDFRLKPGSAAVDRGTALAGITDNFSGKAPDLGALELGQAATHYGPR